MDPSDVTRYKRLSHPRSHGCPTCRTHGQCCPQYIYTLHEMPKLHLTKRTTIHHCPGKNKMPGNCRWAVRPGPCDTHQMWCRNGCDFFHLTTEPCEKCTKRERVSAPYRIYRQRAEILWFYVSSQTKETINKRPPTGKRPREMLPGRPNVVTRSRERRKSRSMMRAIRKGCESLRRQTGVWVLEHFESLGTIDLRRTIKQS